MVARAGFLAAALLLCSCGSIFDSYFPASVEYLVTQTNLSSALGGQPVAAVQIGYLPAGARSSDLLVVTASTQDGASHVLFYNPSNLSLIKSYGSSDLEALNGGVIPNLGLVTQDSTALYTGVVPYNPQTLAPGTVFVPAYFSGSSTTPNFSSVQSVFDTTQSIPYLYSVSGTSLNEFTAATYPAITNTVAGTVALPSGSNLNLLNAVSSGGRFYMLATSNGPVALMNASSASPVSLAPSLVSVSPSNFQNSGWATATAAIVEGHDNNNLILEAYSWSGQQLASLTVPQANNETVSIGFQPNGQSWYLFESSTGQLSREKPWW